MTKRGFIFLLVVTVAAIMIAGTVAERYTQPGFERTLWVAVLSALILFPAARWAERRGWIGGRLQIGDLRKEFVRPGGGLQPPAGEQTPTSQPPAVPDKKN